MTDHVVVPRPPRRNLWWVGGRERTAGIDLPAASVAGVRIELHCG